MTSHYSEKLILGIVAQNENQALEASSQYMGSAFGRRGYAHHIIDMFKPSGADELMELLATGRVDFAYAFAGVGSQLSLTNGINLWTASRTPFVCLWFDHPAYNYRQHIVDSPYIAHAYHVRDHMEARQKYLPASSSQSVLLTYADYANPGARAYPVMRRQREILYAKTAYQPSVLADNWKRHAPLTQRMLWSLVEQAKADRNLDLAGAAAAEFFRHAIPMDNIKLYVGLIQEVDAYIRAWRSDLLARALLPFPARIIGRGWDYLKDEKRLAKICPPIPASEYFTQILECRIIANSNPLWRDGVHNRVENAFNLGSIVLTDRTLKADQVYGGVPSYVGFEWPDDLQDVIATALRLSDNEQIDFYDVADKALARYASANDPDYTSQILKVVEALRNQIPIGKVSSLV